MDIQKLEKIFKENLEEYKKDFGFVCFFGSLNLEKDIDVFISPSKNVKKGYFLKQLILFLEKIRNELIEQKNNLLIVWHSTCEEEVSWLNTKKNTLKIHISSFPDIHPVTIPNYLPVLQRAKKILGNCKSVEEIKKTKLDYFFNYLFISNCLLSNYPKELEKEKIFSKINYIYKQITGKKKELSGSPKKQFFECCDLLDKKAY